MSWQPGEYVTHRFNPDLGIGRIKALEGRAIVVEFPGPRTTLKLAATTDALVTVDLSPGRPVRVLASREKTTIAERLPDGRLKLATGDVVASGALWPLALEGALADRLVVGELDSVQDFAVRLDWLHLMQLREADGLGAFLGGRVRLFPHQLYVAERASSHDPVRWLLADEVGLGKTIEAALILNRLVHTGRVRRCLVVAPEALTVQWLGELWRKYHQVFTLLDAPRLADVDRDFGSGFNPFELHPRAVIGLEMLVERPHLTEQAVAAGIDLLVVDEAQRLRRPPGHPGEPAYRAVAPIAASGRHVLLLSATPLEDDAHGFFRLLQLLRPQDFPDDLSFEERLATGTPLPPCTSATRRVDVGGLPPRVAMPVALDPTGGWPLRAQIEREIRSAPAADPVSRRKKADRIRRILSSGSALRSLLGPEEAPMRRQLDSLDGSDPRLVWLLAQAKRWRDAGEKTLVFVAYRESLDMLRSALSDRAEISSGLFHEELTPARRDTEVARFRAKDGPSILVSTECGGEGRNFEFCRRLVLYDLPWKPSLVEQRIGRLDRIGRQIPVEIVYFQPPSGIARDVAVLFEALGLFREPMAGVEPQLAAVEDAIEAIALDPDAALSSERLDALVADARAARTRIREAAYQELHRNPYRPEMAPEILSRIPGDLDALNESVVTRVCARLGFGIERPRGRRTYAIEFGHEALIDSLPGVPGGSTFVGTFDRENAVEHEMLDFFASGHALVEGVFAHLDESAIGRVARIAIEGGTSPDEGLVAIYKEGAAFEVIALDARGRRRPEWAAVFTRRPVRLRPVPDEGSSSDWISLARALTKRLDQTRRPHALAALVVQPAAKR